MSAVEQIKAEVQKLSISERAEFAKWFNGWTDDEWDKEMAEDFGPGGRHESVLREVDENVRKGRLRDLP